MNRLLIRLFGPYNNHLKCYVLQELLRLRVPVGIEGVRHRFGEKAARWYLQVVNSYSFLQLGVYGRSPFLDLAIKNNTSIIYEYTIFLRLIMREYS